MTTNKRKILTTILEWSIYIILIAGIGFLLVVLGIAPSPLVDGKLMFIIPHKLLGYIFLILILYHTFIHRKWYKAWTSGRIRKTKSYRITKSVSILFLLMIVFFPFGCILPRKVYALGHSGIGITWIILMIYHIRIKRNASGKQRRNVSSPIPPANG